MDKVKKSTQVLNFNAVFLEEENGGYSVSVPALPGCFSQGETFEESIKNIQEAIELFLEDDQENITSQEFKKEFIVPVTVHGR